MCFYIFLFSFNIPLSHLFTAYKTQEDVPYFSRDYSLIFRYKKTENPGLLPPSQTLCQFRDRFLFLSLLSYFIYNLLFRCALCDFFLLYIRRRLLISCKFILISSSTSLSLLVTTIIGTSDVFLISLHI